MRHKILNWGPVVLWMAFIFSLSAQSHPPLVPGGDGIPYVLRKLGHFTEFAVLGALVYRALGFSSRMWLMALIVASLYGASDEWHQSFVPGREMLLTDWIIDSAGAGFGLLLVAQGLGWWARTRAQNNISRGRHDRRI